MNKTRLILFAHGSNDESWRRPFEQLRDRLAARLGEDHVRLAYMEFASPTLDQVAAEAAREGVRSLRLLPLFMAAGGHVDRDIPAQVKAAEAHYPSLSIEILRPVGEDPRLTAALYEIAVDSMGRRAEEARSQ